MKNVDGSSSDISFDRNGAGAKIANLFLASRGYNKSRRGISPVIATTILMGITVTMGLVLWGFANSQTNTAGFAITNGTTSYVNFVNDRFTVVHLAYAYDPVGLCPQDTTCATVWIYNNGDLPTTITAISLGPNTSNMEGKVIKPSSVTIQPKSVGTVTIENGVGKPFTTNTSYVVKVFSSTGAFQEYFEKYVS